MSLRVPSALLPHSAMLIKIECQSISHPSPGWSLSDSIAEMTEKAQPRAVRPSSPARAPRGNGQKHPASPKIKPAMFNYPAKDAQRQQVTTGRMAWCEGTWWEAACLLCPLGQRPHRSARPRASFAAGTHQDPGGRRLIVSKS